MNSSKVRGHQPDYILALVVFILLAIGLILMYSISPVLSHKLLGSVDRNYYFYGQLLNIAVGLVAWIVATSLNYNNWRSWAKLLMIVAGVMLVMLMIPGLSTTKNGATRWLQLGPLSFQPAELLKLAFIVYLAAWFERRSDEVRDFSATVMPFAIMLGAASFVVVVLQRDMGTALVIVMAALGMLYVAGVRLSHFAALLGAGLTLGWLAIVTFPHRVERLTIFLDPSKDPDGKGYHISQALIAIGSGGLFGLGLGHSIQIYGYLPEAANDSIFAIIAEEFGLFGASVVIGLFGILAYRGFKIAQGAPDFFSRLLATGVTLWLLFQAAINIAAMLSLVPLTGIPLPFISYGGTSMLFALVAAGILLNISKYTIKEAANADSGQWWGNRGTHNSASSHGRRAKIAR